MDGLWMNPIWEIPFQFITSMDMIIQWSFHFESSHHLLPITHSALRTIWIPTQDEFIGVNLIFLSIDLVVIAYLLVKMYAQLMNHSKGNDHTDLFKNRPITASFPRWWMDSEWIQCEKSDSTLLEPERWCFDDLLHFDPLIIRFPSSHSALRTIWIGNESVLFHPNVILLDLLILEWLSDEL